MPLKTWLTETLGIRIPVVQGGMQWVGYAEMASAVSNAGGLGILTALTQSSPEGLRAEIARCRTMTSKPFGVNITLLPSITPPDYPAYARVCIEEGIKVVETAGNNPGPVIKILKDAGIIVIHKCVLIKHALSAQKLGVDCLSIDGQEAAGHVGEADIPGLILLAKASKNLKIPFIASGGFSDARGMAAALSLGAQGINMGTRFMCTVEAPIHENVKKSIVKASETDTVLMLRTFKNTARIFKNDIALEVLKIENGGKAEFKDVQALVSGARGKNVYTTGDSNAGVWSVGQGIGLIDDIPTCKALLDRIESGAEDIIGGLNRFVVVEARL